MADFGSSIHLRFGSARWLPGHDDQLSTLKACVVWSFAVGRRGSHLVALRPSATPPGPITAWIDKYNGRPLPGPVEAVWHLATGPLPYIRGRIAPDSVAFNIAPG